MPFYYCGIFLFLLLFLLYRVRKWVFFKLYWWRAPAPNHCITMMWQESTWLYYNSTLTVKYIPFLESVAIETWRKRTPSCFSDTYIAFKGYPMINVWKHKETNMKGMKIFTATVALHFLTNRTLIRMPSMKSHNLTVPSAEQE